MFERTILAIVKPHAEEAEFINSTLFFTATSSIAAKVFDAIRNESGFIIPHMELTKQSTLGEQLHGHGGGGITEWAIDF